MLIPSPRPQKRARIEIIPLIDIMFFLLATFLMVSLSMIKNSGLAVRLPTAEASIAPQEKNPPATVTIAADGGVFFGKDAVSPEELRDRLSGLKKTGSEPRIRIMGDERASFGSCVSVLDIARGQGIERINIITKPAPAP